MASSVPGFLIVLSNFAFSPFRVFATKCRKPIAYALFRCSAASTLSGVRGSEVTRTPMAL
jgi:hypothetical protein